MPSRAQTARNRIGGKLRKNPEADVTELRRDLAAAKVADHVDDWIDTWEPTPEQIALIAAILNPGVERRHHPPRHP